ncbi:hypothetical protein NCU01877 [Neurospora crassa OR74A]|uniref:Uncharacterized protein n=2 Tax=Neurospora crassa TaxID=5141 RepID=Q7SHC9_NEUCR|nr:hypothetical protein NCU01877 [Neurospora crassa OR74A]EAA36272.1 hypothetical protein NCU01877 [Neurospora crassa OR74A]CAE81977.1 hypothetical protein [Neurospora crassa]|eukprot:XP_965508.1 hypothetical protein NCU01877 [Neurospora crassa OR74A]
MSYSGSRYRPSRRQVAAPNDSRSRPSSRYDTPSRTPQPAGGGGPSHGGDSRARSFPADEYLAYSSDDDDDDYDGDFYRRSSGRAPGRAPGGGSSRGYDYDSYDDGYDGDSDRGYSQGGGRSHSSRASVAPRDDRHHGHGGSPPSSSSSHRDEQRYYAPGGLSSSDRHRPHDRDYGHDSGPSPSSRHRDDDMLRGDPRAPMERGMSGHESRREIPFRYVSPFDLGFAGGSRERGGGGVGRSHQDSFGENWNIPSHSRHGRSSARDDAWFSDGESDWSDGFW